MNLSKFSNIVLFSQDTRNKIRFFILLHKCNLNFAKMYLNILFEIVGINEISLTILDVFHIKHFSKIRENLCNSVRNHSITFSFTMSYSIPLKN